MGMLVKCSKGCGEAIEVTTEMIEEATKRGRALDVQHEVCPNEDGAVMRHFKMQTVIVEVTQTDEGERTETLASIGGDVEAESFVRALPKLNDMLSGQWGRVVGMADIVDSDYEQEKEMARASNDAQAD